LEIKLLAAASTKTLWRHRPSRHGSNGELPVRYVSDWPVTLGPCQRSEGRTIKPGSPAAFPVVPRRSQQPEAMAAELRDYLNLRYDGEATVAAEIGVESSSLADWLVRESSTQP